MLLLAALLCLATLLLCSKSFGTYLHEQGNQRLRQQAQQLMDTAAQLLKLAESQGQGNIITQQQKAAAVRCLMHSLYLLCSWYAGS
jgi:hypothetical protein